MEIIDRSDPDVSFEGTGARFNTVLKTGPKIDPKTVPNSLFFGFLALLFEGFFGTLLGTILGTVFGTVLNRAPDFNLEAALVTQMREPTCLAK